ncbi:MAG: ubiquinol-cytochrome c reductase iron-sulfur subunit [bacterium]|nr:ubiquinol-cytochrome c reductase iron-sulfur subunit [Gammaproteobacteria bacterium]HIL95892.1 ubiquinol-cytochrome c reductase iron-sulfur subunit [Pseudomonadales bacterium]
MDRRRLLTRIVQGFSVTGLAFFTYPFLKAWIPSFDQDLSLEVPLGDLAPGQSKLVHWLGRNLYIVRRKPETIAALTVPSRNLKDPDSKISQQPDFANNVFRSLRPEFFVTFSNCTHLGCEVVPEDGSFKCPCHESDYDPAGRVVEGAAAPTNLEIPSYRFVSRKLILLEQLDT